MDTGVIPYMKNESESLATVPTQKRNFRQDKCKKHTPLACKANSLLVYLRSHFLTFAHLELVSECRMETLAEMLPCNMCDEKPRGILCRKQRTFYFIMQQIYSKLKLKLWQDLSGMVSIFQITSR